MDWLIAIGTGIVGKLAEYTVEPVIRQVGYLFRYSDNLRKLRNQVVDLGDAKQKVDRAVQTEKDKGKRIENDVQTWLTRVDEITEQSNNFLADKHQAKIKCLHGFCPNLKNRHQLSRKSTKLAQEVAELCGKKDFSSFGYEVKPEEVFSKDNQAFASRISVVKDILDELRKSSINMIGVYGIGGVGKTTLVKEVYRQVTDEKLFDDVVIILDVKQNPSIERIQKEIAESLRLDQRENETEAGRARRIADRIKGQKTLVILDDVWETIELEGAGLSGMTTLTLLFTSRSGKVLSSNMCTQKEFRLEVLGEEESWSLFEKTAGDIVKDPTIRTVETKIMQKCGGLPLLVLTVARGLKNSSLPAWRDALRRMQKLDGQELTDKAYSAIEWSYSKLENQDLKSLFLLCASELGSGNSFGILYLLKYSMGLGLIKDVDTIEEAEDALHSLLEKLEYSCLLLEDTDDNSRIRMHEVVQDVAKRIASRDHHILSFYHGHELKEWPNDEFCKKCTFINLYCKPPKFPEVLHCPELKLFLLERSTEDSSQEIPCHFFKEMRKLRVLDLTSFSMPSLPSLEFLKDLRTLCLDHCIMRDISLIGQLQNLEILSFLKSKFEVLPKEIGQLTRLRLLNLTGCSQLRVISPNVLSSLNRLQHLKMGDSFNQWEAEGFINSKRSNANLEELRHLSQLTLLQIHIPDANTLPADFFSEKLERFQICIGSAWKWADVDKNLNTLKLKLTTDNKLDRGLKLLLKRTEDLYLEGTENVNSSILYQLQTEDFQRLKHLHFQNNADFAYINNEKGNFPNLTWLAVSELNSSGFLLSSSMARSLANLKRLQISRCQIMEEIVSMDGENTDNIFCQLQVLQLKDLPNLTKFCSRCYTELPNPSFEIVIQHFLLDNKVEFPNLKELLIDGLAKLTSIWTNHFSPSSSNTLEKVEIVSCENLKSIFPVEVARSLQQLRTLEVEKCGVEEIVSNKVGTQTAPVFDFPKLTYVKFENLPRLRGFYPGSHISNWPSLVTLMVYYCHNVQIFKVDKREWNNLYTRNEQYLFSFEKDSFPNLEYSGFTLQSWDNPPFHSFRKLKQLIVYAHSNSSIDSLEKLLGVSSGEIHAVGSETLPHLRDLQLYGMRKLMDLGENYYRPARVNFPNLEILVLGECDSLKNLISSAISFKTLTTLQVSVCKGLKYLITCSIARSLEQLRKLEVEDCEEMTEILANSEDCYSRNEIEFKQLKTLKLSALPRLRGFCSGTHIVRFPSLESLSLSCPHLETFIFHPKGKGCTIGKEIEQGDSKENFETKESKSLNYAIPQSGCHKVEKASEGNLSLQGMQCPELVMFHYASSEKEQSLEIHDNYFEGMKKLKVLDLILLNIPSLPSSLQFLQSLQSLCLDLCTLGDITIVGELRNLEILRLHKSKFKQLPKEIGRLTRLRLLDLTGCSQLQVIPPNVISRLERLEDLMLGMNSFNQWEAEGVISTQRNNANLEELKHLTQLTTLHIHIPNADILPEHLFSSKLRRFQICLGSAWKWEDVDRSLNTLKLKLTNSNELDLGLKMLVERTEDLYLEGLEGANNSILYQLFDTEGLQQVKRLHVQNNIELSHTVAGKVYFPNLTWLEVSELNSSKFLLSSSMARSLAQLKHLQITRCKIVEEIVSMDEETVGNMFCQLQHLELKDLPNLTKFCSRCYTELPNPSFEIVIQHFLLDNKVEFPNLKELLIDGLAKLTSIWTNHFSPSSSNTLEKVEIVSCENLKSIFPVEVARNLQQLRTLKVEKCGVEEIVSNKVGTQTAPVFDFPKLTYVKFENLRRLGSFYPGSHTSNWPSLVTLMVYNCHNVQIFKVDKHEWNNLYTRNEQYLFSFEKDSFPNLEYSGFTLQSWDNPPFHSFRKLKQLIVYAHSNSSFDSLEKLLGVSSGEIHAVGSGTLPHLRKLVLYGMRKLMDLGEDSYRPAGAHFPNLEVLELEKCDSLKNLKSSAISFEILTTLEVSDCRGLKYLLTYSIAKSLTRLTKLQVESCSSLVEIVGSNEDDDDSGDDDIAFRRLKILKLCKLPRLQSFWSRNRAVKFPSLGTLSISNRLKLKIFPPEEMLQTTTEEEDTDAE